jgi:hypothetical protein
MGQVDFGKIISAAAVSTLGVLSLIIVALGVIAFFFFKGSPEKVKLSVWWTMVLAGGLFAGAVVSQSGPKGPEQPEPRPTPTRTAEPIDPPRPRPTETPEPELSPTPTPKPTFAVPPSPTPTPASEQGSPDLSGRWHDDDGYTYLITVSGNTIAMQQWMNGTAAGYGQGAISGRNLRYGFVTADGNQGTCTATAAPNNRRITGMCASGAATWPFTVER